MGGGGGGGGGDLGLDVRQVVPLTQFGALQDGSKTIGFDEMANFYCTRAQLLAAGMFE